MSSLGMMRPFVVAAFFYDLETNSANQMVRAVSQVGPDVATGQAVAMYYMEGGRLPLMATAVIEISRDTLEKGTAMLDAIDAADKAEADKVVGLREAPGIDQNGLRPTPQAAPQELHDALRPPGMADDSTWDGCAHEWVERGTNNGPGRTGVRCGKCQCPGERDDNTGEVYWPT